MNVHFICRGNVLRSLTAETYLNSLHLTNVTAISSGVTVDLEHPREREFFTNTIAVLKRHDLDPFVKDTSHQLTQERVRSQDVTICMNKRVFDEASLIVTLPVNTRNWNIVDIGEGHRTDRNNRSTYEEDIFNEITSKVDELITELRL